MKTKFKLILILVGLTAMLSSCRTSAPRLDYQALARLLPYRGGHQYGR